MDTRQHVLTSFDEALQRLGGDLAAMASLTRRSLENARLGLEEADLERFNAAIADDDEIDQLEIAVGSDGVEVLRRFQPVARDLRHVVSALRLCGDIERVADQAVNIARKARKIDVINLARYRDRLSAMLAAATALFTASVQSYEDGDVALARDIPVRDRRLDELNAEITEQATAEIARSPEHVADHLAVILIARHIERIGDHAKNIAENAIFVVSDEDVRHRRPDQTAFPA